MIRARKDSFIDTITTNKEVVLGKTTRRGFLGMATSLAALLAGCAATSDSEATKPDTADGQENEAKTEQATEQTERETITCDGDGEHAIAVSGEAAAYTAVDVKKTGDADGDEADFYGTNAAVYAEEGATLDLVDVTVTTDGLHANAVFSYGEGTTVNIANSTIDTTNNCSGGIMVTGGGTLNANDLTVHTTGNSSASIRSDRGGGVQNVSGGSYTTDGMGSPVVYSTAEVHVSGATMESTSSQGVVVEGKNSVELTDCELTASNTSKNSDKSDWYQAVMIYQSMSGDAAQGAASFALSGGSLVNKNGDVFFVNNTVTTIDLAGASITNEDAEGNFLRAAAAGWGNEGSNGGHVTLKASKQEISGNMLVDEVSTLNMYLKGGSNFVGAINPEGQAGEVYVELEDGSTWQLTADATITSLTCGADAIALNGYALNVGGTMYEEGSSSAGDAIEVEIPESTGGPGGDGQPPEAPPDGEGGTGGPGGPGGPGGDGGEPPAKPGEK